MGQSMVGVLEKIVSFYIPWTPHLNMLLKLSNTFILKVSFYSYRDTLQRNCSMHKSNLNKFKDLYQILEKNPRLYLRRKNQFKDS